MNADVSMGEFLIRERRNSAKKHRAENLTQIAERRRN